MQYFNFVIIKLFVMHGRCIYPPDLYKFRIRFRLRTNTQKCVDVVSSTTHHRHQVLYMMLRYIFDMQQIMFMCFKFLYTSYVLDINLKGNDEIIIFLNKD